MKRASIVWGAMIAATLACAGVAHAGSNVHNVSKRHIEYLEEKQGNDAELKLAGTSYVMLSGGVCPAVPRVVEALRSALANDKQVSVEYYQKKSSSPRCLRSVKVYRQ